MFLLILLSPFLRVALTTQAQAGSPWTRYTGKNEEFSVMLPELPAAYSKLRPEFASEQRPPRGADYDRGRIYGAYGDGIVYVIMSFDKGGREKLDDFIKAFQKYFRPQVEISFVRDLSQDDINAREYCIQLSGVEGITHFYFTKSHIYVVQAVGADERNPNIRRFLTSLTINGKALWKDFPESERAVEPSSTQAIASANEFRQSSEVFSVKDVSRKAIVVMRPEPRFPRPEDIQGRIRIKAVLSSSGSVENIDVVEGPRKLMTEAIEAIRKIKFIPAIKDGEFVSQYFQVEYQFHTLIR
jgi:TonB family protein